MTYEMSHAGQVFAGCSPAKERDSWYFLDLREYPEMANNRVLVHLYDCGPLSLRQLQRKEMEIKNAVLDIINAEIKYGSIIVFQKNGITKYKLTEVGKDIAKMHKEKVATWEYQKRLREEL